MNKTKIALCAQTVLIGAVLMAGFLLKGDLTDGPREAHRLLGMLAGLGSAVVFVGLVVKKKSKDVVIASGIATALALVAGFAGKSLATTPNYDQMFDVMRISGTLAFASAVVGLVRFLKSVKRAK